MSTETTQTIIWKGNSITCNEKLLFQIEEQTPVAICAALYKLLNLEYPKFFKMDILSKTAVLLTELLLQTNNHLSLSHQLNTTAVVLATTKGCISVDKQFNATIENIPSPALFVYTLPNIMLGEICIKHHFKGEQMCFIHTEPQPDFLNTYAIDLLEHRGSTSVITGYVEATDTNIEAQMWMLHT